LHPYEQSDEGNSASRGKVSATALSTFGSGTSVLLLVDANTAGTTALVNALTTAGCAVTVRPPPEYTWNGTNPPPDDFQCVIHLNGLTFGTPLPVSAQTALVNFVQNGGGFIGSQWNGFERAIGQQTAMNDLVLQLWPFPDNCGGCTMTWTVVPGQESHPVLAGVPSPFTFFADGHDAGTQVVFAVNPSTVLMRSPGGGPAVLVREFGSGRVVNFSSAANYFSGLTLQDPNIQKLYTNAVNWACNRVEEKCPRSIGYFRSDLNRIAPLPQTIMNPGADIVVSTPTEALEILRGRGRNANDKLRAELLVTLLNLGRGPANGSCIQPTVDAAQNFLEMHGDKNLTGSEFPALHAQATEIIHTLNAYNENRPPCGGGPCVE